MVIVHQGAPEEGKAFLRQFRGTEEFIPVADPERKLFRAMGLPQARFGQVLGPRVWVRGIDAIAHGHRVGKPMGDPLQLAAAFLIHKGAVASGVPARDVADVPDYRALLRGLTKV